MAYVIDAVLESRAISYESYERKEAHTQYQFVNTSTMVCNMHWIVDVHTQSHRNN